jgi:acyl dehydratase
VAIDPAHVGRRYGPFRFTVGLEHLRDFVAATAGGAPGRVLGRPPRDAHPWTWDERAAAASPYGGLVAPPGFAATFAIEPFAAACADPALALDLRWLVHGEQELELLAPIRPGDVLVTTGEITAVKERPRLDLLEVTTTTRSEHGELVVRGTWTALVRKPGPVERLVLAGRRILSRRGS